MCKKWCNNDRFIAAIAMLNDAECIQCIEMPSCFKTLLQAPKQLPLESGYRFALDLQLCSKAVFFVLWDDPGHQVSDPNLQPSSANVKVDVFGLGIGWDLCTHQTTVEPCLSSLRRIGLNPDLQNMRVLSPAKIPSCPLRVYQASQLHCSWWKAVSVQWSKSLLSQIRDI